LPAVGIHISKIERTKIRAAAGTVTTDTGGVIHL